MKTPHIVIDTNNRRDFKGAEQFGIEVLDPGIDDGSISDQR